MSVLSTDHGDESATMTVRLADDNHKFDVKAEGDVALVSYQETLTWRAQVEVLPDGPDDEVLRMLATSDEMITFLEEHSLDRVKMEDRQA